jgi:CRISPR-associated protein Csx10
MKVIVYNLELTLPLLTTDIQSEPNGSVTKPFISGTQIRGALIGAYLKASGSNGFDALDDIKARALFLDETTRYLNAYPLLVESADELGYRALPTPESWRYDKNDNSSEGQRREIYDLSCPEPIEIQEKHVAGDFVWLRGNGASLYGPIRQINIHTRRNARLGRSTEDSGDIYRYQALASGTHWQGAIFTADEYAECLEQLMCGARFWIGRARRAGYGEISVTKVQTLDYWHELNSDREPPAIEAGSELQVTFISDAIFRDENGKDTLDPRSALSTKLGLSASALICQPVRSYAVGKRIGGFNRKWGLPLPQSTAIAAGSVFTFDTTEPIEGDAIETLEREGIGLRRGEGFGRVLVNWLQQPRYIGHIFDYFKGRGFLSPPQSLDPDEKQFALTLASRLLRQQLDYELRRRVNLTKLVKPPSKHQLMRLRVLLRTAQSAQGFDQALWEASLDKLQRRGATAERYAAASVTKGDCTAKLIDWLKKQMLGAPQLWSFEPISFSTSGQPLLATVTEPLAREYAIRFIDSILYRSTKEE